jgi:exodeoxyribonuclease III
VKIATYNVNGIKARLPRLIEWLNETQPDIVCLQEVKSSDETIPVADVEAAGYGGVWHGQKGFNGVAILARGETPVLVKKGLDGEPEDEMSRYIEADVMGVRVASIYLPNGNPQPGPKFDYKLRWMERLRARAVELLALEIPVVLAGDYNVIPTDADIANPKAGRMRCVRCILPVPYGPIGIIRPVAGNAMPVSASTICCSARKPLTG